MIFYFTGTGNSFEAAQIIAQTTDDTLVDIGHSIKHGHNEFVVEEGENLGFVCPTHAWSTPPIVDTFLKEACFRDSQGNLSSPGYSYLVLTCGAFVGNTARFFARNLYAIHGINLDASFSITTVGSCVALYSPAEGQKRKSLLEEARIQTRDVAHKIALKSTAHEEKRHPFGIFMSHFSCTNEKKRSTSNFYTLSTCTRCGQCIDICPTNTIFVRNNRPCWAESGCTHCYACIHRCPPHAIQYGKKTETRARFVNPALLERE